MNRHTVLLLLSCFFCCRTFGAPTSGAKHAGERGNWVKKREWVKQAQTSNEQLQKDVLAIQKSHKTFYEQFEEFENHSNTFYRKKGFNQGKIEELVNDLRADIKTEKEVRIAKARGKSEGGDMPFNYYDIQIEAIEDDVKRLEKEIQQFKFDMKAIADVERSLSERLKVLDKHSKESVGLGEKGAHALEEMWWMIDDKKARTSYYQIKGFADRAASIKKYINGPLLQDFKKVGDTLKQQTSQVESQVESLEQRGLVVEHRTERLVQQKEKREKLEQQLREHSSDEEEEVPIRRKKRRKTPPSMLESLFAPVRMLVTAIAAPFKYVLSFFVTVNGPTTQAQRRNRKRRNKERQERRAARQKERHMEEPSAS